MKRDLLKAVFLYLLTRLAKLPQQCFSNEPGNMGNLGSSKEMQPKIHANPGH